MVNSKFLPLCDTIWIEFMSHFQQHTANVRLDEIHESDAFWEYKMAAQQFTAICLYFTHSAVLCVRTCV